METFYNASEIVVLIVDDDKIASLVHKKVLKEFQPKIQPSFFGNGKDALEFIQSYRGEASFLVLLDLEMPIMNGWEFLEKCTGLENSSKIFFLMITASPHIDDLYRTLSYKNVLGFSRKPFTGDSMKSLLDFPEIQNLFLQMEYEALENDTW